MYERESFSGIGRQHSGYDWVTDDHGNVEFANKTYLKYFEVALEGVAGQRWKDLVHPDDYESYSQQFLAASIVRRSFLS